jgi:hypothetical protein
MHWRTKHRRRTDYFEACDLITLGGGLVNLPPRKAKITATIFCGGQMDHDNALARLKWPVDWMVNRGYLIGDKPSQLEWDWPIEQVVKRDGNYRVTFTITEISA